MTKPETLIRFSVLKGNKSVFLTQETDSALEALDIETCLSARFPRSEGFRVLRIAATRTSEVIEL